MDEYIDRGALIEWLKRIRLIDLSDGFGLCRVIMEDDFKKAIKEMPKGIIADVAPVRHGRWISKNPHGYEWTFVCSNCGYVDGYPFNDRHNYCPNCGAKMHGGDNDAAD